MWEALMTFDSRKKSDSISGRSVEHFITNDDTLASLLVNHGIRVRDFILLSFLSDQGPMSIERLSRVVGLEPTKTQQGLERLSAANLVLREPAPAKDKLNSIARLTTRGEDVARRIGEQLE
jgi:DNA-binding MarR family transcriptional regulator